MRPRAWRHALGFLLALALSAALLPWRQGDWALFAYLPRGASVHLGSAPISLIDVDYSTDAPTYRAQVAGLLELLASGAAGWPDAVVLDIQFQHLPTEGLDRLERALRALRDQQRTKVYGAVYIFDELQPSRLNPHFMDRHARALYVNVMDGFGHTFIQRRQRTAMYEAYADLGNGVRIPALPVLLAERHFSLDPQALQGPQLLDMGPESEVAARTHRFEQGRLLPAAGGSGKVNLDRQIVIVGSPRSDRADPAGRAGPEILLWATLARMRNADNPTAAAVLASPWLLLGLVGVFSAVSTWATRLAMAAGPRLLRGAQATASWLCPVIGLLAAGAGMVALSMVLLMARHTYVQWTLVLLASALAGLFAWAHQRAVLAWGRQHLEASDGPRLFDVFISYSRTPPENADWVEAHVHTLLSTRGRRPDGRPLKVFFDKTSLEGGSNWTQLVEDVYQSQVFVAVYSDEYFAKPVCRYELGQALALHMAESAVDLPFIVPVMRQPVMVPRSYRTIQYLDASDTGFAKALLERVDDLVARRHARQAVAAAGQPVG